MLSRRLAPLFLLLTLGLFASARADAPALDSAAADTIVQEALKAFEVPGASVAIVKDDQVIYLKGFGTKKAGEEQPVTPDTLFAVGSTTKAFTTTAMAMLVEDGKMAWDDPVRKHIPFFHLSDPLADQNVTLRDLVTHRTGLSRHDMLWYSSPWSREEIIRRIGQVKLTKPFRSTWQYQNIAFVTAGYAVEKASGVSWEDFVQKRIFDALGMKSANFSVSVAEKAADVASPHIKDDAGKIKPIPWVNVDNVGPAGSINAGARDMAQWVRFQLGDGTFEGKKLVSSTALEETHTPQMVVRFTPSGKREAEEEETTQQSYGMGWMVWDYRGKLVVSHGGNIDGFTARVSLLPRQRLGVVVLANRNSTLMNTAVTDSLVDLGLGLPKKEWNAFYTAEARRSAETRDLMKKAIEAKRHKDTKPSRELEAYAGIYEEPAYGDVTVSVENGALQVAWSKFKTRLEHWHYDTFQAKGEGGLQDDLLTFALGPDGEVSTLTLLGQEFHRKLKSPNP